MGGDSRWLCGQHALGSSLPTSSTCSRTADGTLLFACWPMVSLTTDLSGVGPASGKCARMGRRVERGAWAGWGGGRGRWGGRVN
eukprot:363853-Chlamydomonas_euryale.AAC.1